MPRLTFATMLAPSLLPFYEGIADAVGEELGVTTELVVENDYAAFRDDVHDLYFVCGLPYVTFERDSHDVAGAIAAPVLSGNRYLGRPVYYSDVIVRRGSSFQAFEDLRGASWAYNEPLSQSGYGIVRYHLLQLGETESFFGSVVASGFHGTSIEMVRSGEIDASAIDSQVLSIAWRDDPQLSEEIRVIAALGPSTIQPVAASRRLDREVRDEVRRVLTSAHEYPALRSAFGHAEVDRFVPVGPDHYDDIRQMLVACENADFTVLR